MLGIKTVDDSQCLGTSLSWNLSSDKNNCSCLSSCPYDLQNPSVYRYGLWNLADEKLHWSRSVHLHLLRPSTWWWKYIKITFWFHHCGLSHLKRLRFTHSKCRFVPPYLYLFWPISFPSPLSTCSSCMQNEHRSCKRSQQRQECNVWPFCTSPHRTAIPAVFTLSQKCTMFGSPHFDTQVHDMLANAFPTKWPKARIVCCQKLSLLVLCTWDLKKAGGSLSAMAGRGLLKVKPVSMQCNV